MEKKQKNVTLMTEDELKKEKKKKQLAIIKSSNEMLQYAKECVINSDRVDEIQRSERVKEIETAIEENKMRAETYLQATPEDIQQSVYKEVSEEEKLKYEERLKKKGITEESLTRMDMATVSTGKETKKTSKRKYTVKNKRKEKEEDILINEEIVRLPNEDELMKKSLATPDKIEEKIRKNKKQEDKLIKEIKDNIDTQKVKETEPIKEVKVETKKSKTKEKETFVKYDFDFSTIPDWVQYDVIPLPSKGECYPIDSPLRCGRVPVAMLTAADENIIASPNMYRDGKIVDIILQRKILDKRIDIDQLCKGDRDAIVLWLRATGYDTDFPIIATHPDTGKQYDVVVKLHELKYKEFDLEGDDDGNFTYETMNGDIIKFNFITQSMEDLFRQKFISKNIDIEKVNINQYLNNIENSLRSITDLDNDDINDIKGCVSDIKDILNESIKEEDIDETSIVVDGITEQMILYTKSINGNDDTEYIRNYIENMRSNDAYRYRTLVNSNKPGVDFEITINVPESDGGGSFITFLRLGNDVFLNI